MKSSILFLISLILLQGMVHAQTPSDCTPLPQLATLYRDDVKDLALQRIYALHSPDTALIKIPQRYQDTVLAGLAAICNTDSLIQADSVFRAYCIHEFPNGKIITSMFVKVDTSFAWTHSWAGLFTSTGNASLDSLMSKYGFRVTYYSCISSHAIMNNIATIETDQAINTFAFADSIARFPGVEFVYPGNHVGDHNWITYERDSVSRYEFRLGWEDCPSGCMSTKIWKYTVDNSCNVALISVYIYAAMPFPDPINCNLIPVGMPIKSRHLDVSVYPNPVSDVLHISLGGNVVSATYSLTDLSGREVNNGIAGNGITSMNLSQLSAGIYVLKVSGGGMGTVYRKIVVE